MKLFVEGFFIFVCDFITFIKHSLSDGSGLAWISPTILIV